jgi:hypothetical protein
VSTATDGEASHGARSDRPGNARILSPARRANTGGDRTTPDSRIIFTSILAPQSPEPNRAAHQDPPQATRGPRGAANRRHPFFHPIPVAATHAGCRDTGMLKGPSRLADLAGHGGSSRSG